MIVDGYRMAEAILYPFLVFCGKGQLLEGGTHYGIQTEHERVSHPHHPRESAPMLYPAGGTAVPVRQPADLLRRPALYGIPSGGPDPVRRYRPAALPPAVPQLAGAVHRIRRHLPALSLARRACNVHPLPQDSPRKNQRPRAAGRSGPAGRKLTAAAGGAHKTGPLFDPSAEKRLRCTPRLPQQHGSQKAPPSGHMI